MATNQLIGLMLLGVAALDVVLAFLVVGPRIPDAGKRRRVQIGILVGAGAMLALGAAFLSGAIGGSSAGNAG